MELWKHEDFFQLCKEILAFLMIYQLAQQITLHQMTLHIRKYLLPGHIGSWLELFLFEM